MSLWKNTSFVRNEWIYLAKDYSFRLLLISKIETWIPFPTRCFSLCVSILRSLYIVIVWFLAFQQPECVQQRLGTLLSNVAIEIDEEEMTGHDKGSRDIIFEQVILSWVFLTQPEDDRTGSGPLQAHDITISFYSFLHHCRC